MQVRLCPAAIKRAASFGASDGNGPLVVGWPEFPGQHFVELMDVVTHGAISPHWDAFLRLRIALAFSL